MRTFFNLLMPAIIMVYLPYRHWESVTQNQLEVSEYFWLSVTFFGAIGFFIYRVNNLRKRAE